MSEAVLLDDDTMLDGEVFAVFVDGETKTGKGAAGGSTANALIDAGYVVYHDVAGDFYRRFAELVRRELGLREEDALPSGDMLKQAAQSVYASQRAFEKDDSLGDLQRASVSNSVSTLAKLNITQKAGGEWISLSVERARKMGAQIIVLDGRNLRDQFREQDDSIRESLTLVLDLYLTCDPETAARRTLFARKISNPSDTQVTIEKRKVEKRRQEDRERPKNPFVMPTVIEEFIPGETPAEEVIMKTWETHDDAEVPASVILDNSHISKPDMLESVAELAVAAVRFRSVRQTVRS